MSADSVKIYEEAEQNNMKLIQNIRKFVIIGLISCYLPSLLVPISYLVIRFPEPELWILPFPVNFIFLAIFRYFFCQTSRFAGWNCESTHIFWLLHVVDCAIWWRLCIYGHFWHSFGHGNRILPIYQRLFE